MTEQPSIQSRLSRIETLWSVVRRAHDDDENSRDAQRQLLERYGGAIRRYLLAAVRNSDLADELFQEFAVKFINGEFQTVDPSKGRFRSFVKTVLYRLVALHYRKKKSKKEQSLADDLASAEPTQFDASEEDELFLVSWRDDVLARVWQALASHEQQTGVPYNTVLRIRVSDPTLSSEALAKRMEEALGKPTTPGSARVTVHRAREKFAHLLIEVIADSLESPDRPSIEAELIDLRLIDYCRDTLDSLES